MRTTPRTAKIWAAFTVTWVPSIRVIRTSEAATSGEFTVTRIQWQLQLNYENRIKKNKALDKGRVFLPRSN